MNDVAEQDSEGRYIALSREEGEVYEASGLPFVLKSEIDARKKAAADAAALAAQKAKIRAEVDAEMQRILAEADQKASAKLKAEAQAEADKKTRIEEINGKIEANNKIMARIDGSLPELEPLWAAFDAAAPNAFTFEGRGAYDEAVRDLGDAGVTPAVINLRLGHVRTLALPESDLAHVKRQVAAAKALEKKTPRTAALANVWREKRESYKQANKRRDAKHA